MPETQPDDLIPVSEAARLVDRSVSTLRAWVRASELQGYYEDPNHPENSRLMVSRRALIALASQRKSTSPPRPAPGPRTPEETTPSVSTPATQAPIPAQVSVLVAELDGARALLEAVRAQLVATEARSRTLEDQVRTERQRAEEWKGRATAIDAELRALKERERLPIWRRLLTGPRSRD